MSPEKYRGLGVLFSALSGAHVTFRLSLVCLLFCLSFFLSFVSSFLPVTLRCPSVRVRQAQPLSDERG